MNSLNHSCTLARYNWRLNQQMLAVASSLSHDQLVQDRGAFFKSILGTLNHILVGDRLWLRRFYLHNDNEVFSHLKGESSIKNFGEVVVHIFNHQNHHQGQTSTLLMQAGVDIGITDYLMDIH